MQNLLKLFNEAKPFYKQGKKATYIPALSEACEEHFAVYLLDEHGTSFSAGEVSEEFTLQSISKIISFIYVCQVYGVQEVLKFVDVEPTGDAFNSIMRLESHQSGKPFNPMINAGAITVSSMLPGNSKDQKLSKLIDFIASMIDRRCKVNEQVFQSELVTAYRNRAIAYYLKENGYLQGDVETALQVYLMQCSIEIEVEQLAQIALVIANDGYHPFLKKRLFEKEVAKIAKALMMTCGMYNASGNFAAFVGLPAKSGVSGGILCVAINAQMDHLKGNIGIGVYGPAIDEIGNSKAGLEFLKKLSLSYDLSLF